MKIWGRRLKTEISRYVRQVRNFFFFITFNKVLYTTKKKLKYGEQAISKSQVYARWEIKALYFGGKWIIHVFFVFFFFRVVIQQGTFISKMWMLQKIVSCYGRRTNTVRRSDIITQFVKLQFSVAFILLFCHSSQPFPPFFVSTSIRKYMNKTKMQRRNKIELDFQPTRFWPTVFKRMWKM